MNRQTYKEIEYDEYPNYRCDVFQIKYDGIWIRGEVTKHECHLYSQTGKLKTIIPVRLPVGIPNFTFIGEYMFGSQRSQRPEFKDNIYMFDLVKSGESDLTDTAPYIQRLRKLAVLSNYLTAQFRLVKCFQIQTLPEAWQASRGIDEGFILRNMYDLYTDTLYKLKYETTRDYYAVAFYQGQGRLANRLGAVGVALQPGGPEIMRVGGGFKDEERQAIWNNLTFYENARIEVCGKGDFESGALRHPSFVRWRFND